MQDQSKSYNDNRTIIQWSDVPLGGARRVVSNFASSLRKNGFTVVNVSPPTGLAGNVLSPSDLNSIQFPNSPLRRIPILRRLLSTRILKSEFHWYMDEFARTLRTLDPVHVLFHPSMRMACPPVPSLECPSSLYLQEPNRGLFEAQPDIWWGQVFRSNPPHIQLRSLANHLNNAELGQNEWGNIRKYSNVFCNSTYSQSSISTAYGLVPTVVHLGVDTEFFTPDSSVKREDIVLCVGVSRLKQIDRVIRAVSIHDRNSVVVVLGICGDRKYISELQELAASESVSLRFLCPDDEGLRQLYRSSKFCVFVPRNEPFGLVPLEAVACGCPTLVTSIGGPADILASGIGIPTNDDPESIAEVLSDASRNYQHCLSQTSAMRNRIYRYWSLDLAASRLVKAMGL